MNKRTLRFRFVKVISCCFEIVILCVSIVHDLFASLDKVPVAGSFLVDDTAVEVSQKHVKRVVTAETTKVTKVPAAVTTFDVPDYFQKVVAEGKRILLIDFENSCQNVTKELLGKSKMLADDVSVCVVSQFRPVFWNVSAAQNFMWVGLAIGKKETADLVIEKLISNFADITTLFLLHGGDHRWYDVAQKYRVEAHVVDGNGAKGTAKRGAVEVIQKWSLGK